MPRRKREESEGSAYHVVRRGVGQQTLFEDDADRSFFLGLLEKHVAPQGGGVLAWCPMSNRTHLLAAMRMDAPSAAMKAVGVSYARHFNDRHARSGHLFRDRFHSEPASDGVQLMVTVRYMHANPLEAGAGGFPEYPWSSYPAYTGAAGDGLTETETVPGVFGGIEAFERFHAGGRSGDGCLDARPGAARAKLTEEQAPRKAKDAVGSGEIFQLKSLPREERDAALRRLKEEGVTTRQIMRITGISLGVISRA